MILSAAPRTNIFDRLLGLDRLSLSDSETTIGFAHEVPLWGWAILLGALAILAFWSYARLAGSRPGRRALGGLRFLVFALIALMVAGPQVMKRVERVEKDSVIVMIDRSRSMLVRDVAGAPGGGRITRDEQLRTILNNAAPVLDALAKDRDLTLLGFDAGVYELPARGAADWPPAPTGARTSLGASLEDALARSAGRPIAGIVLLSDGRSFDAPARSLISDLTESRVSVFPVALGSDQALPDLAIARVDAPQAAFLGDVVPISVTLDRAAGSGEATGVVQLVDAQGVVLDEKPVPFEGDRARVSLSLTPKEAGATDLSVRVVTQDAELTTDNNEQRFRLELIDRPVRIAHFDGYPRWEFRYLKNLLLRDPSFQSASLVIAPDRRYLQEGAVRIESLPRSPQDWAAFDVVILGDVRPGLFQPEQLQHLRDAVAQRGLGLLWIAGPSYTPGAWANTPLGDLLPFTQNAENGASLPTFASPVVVRPGPSAPTYGVLQLDGIEGWPNELTDSDLGWNTLRWAQMIEPGALKPSTEVLALANVPGSETASPLITTMRFGAGRVLYVATDESWRYRYGRGETLTERLWIPLLRLLARGSLGRTGQPATLEASPQTALLQHPVRITLRLLDQSLADKKPRQVSLIATTRVDPAIGDSLSSTITLTPAGQGEESQAVQEFIGTFIPSEPGRWTITPQDTLLAGLSLGVEIDVIAPEDETKRPQADHPALAALAKETGGRVLSPKELSDLPAILPNRELRILGTPQIETLWDKPLTWAILITLLCLEWIGRRLLRLA